MVDAQPDAVGERGLGKRSKGGFQRSVVEVDSARYRIRADGDLARRVGDGELDRRYQIRHVEQIPVKVVDRRAVMITSAAATNAAATSSTY